MLSHPELPAVLKSLLAFCLLGLLAGCQSPPTTVDLPLEANSPMTPTSTATPFQPETPTPALLPTEIEVVTIASLPTDAPAIPLTPTSVPPHITLLFTGVIVPARCVQAAIDAREDANYVYDDVRKIIKAADLAIGTLNTTLSDYPPHTGCRFTYVLISDSRSAVAARKAG